jgi:hypothetical protein
MALLTERIRTCAPPVVLHLDVGLPDWVDLLSERDLDNYLYPLATHLHHTAGVELASAWATRRPAPRCYVQLETAIRPVQGPACRRTSSVAAADAIKAARVAAPEGEDEAAGRLECQWQRDELPEAIRELVLDDQRFGTTSAGRCLDW